MTENDPPSSSPTTPETPRDQPDVERFRISSDCSHREFLAVARIYAREVVEEHSLTVSVEDLEWEVSTRAKRRAGAVKYADGEPETVSLTWGYFEENGWVDVASTIRHELIHVHLLNEYGESGHGERFRRLAERLDTSVHCELFTEPEWWVECSDCSNRLARYRNSRLVRATDEYVCGECGGDLVAERND